MYKLNEIHEKHYSSVDEIFEYIYSELVTREYDYGFRGHSDSEWKLEPTIIRYIDTMENNANIKKYYFGEQQELTALVIKKLHTNFKNNLIANNDLPQDIVEKIDLWQYGQHFGLPSPLLDWTYSPYIALFFALASPLCKERCLWVLNLGMVRHLNHEIVDTIRPKFKEKISPESFLNEQFPTMEIISELNENNRRISFQQGFFTKHEYYRSLEVWLNRITPELNYHHSNQLVLEKHIFRCNDDQRTKALDKLDKMNINHRILFPDIFGSVQHAIDETSRSIHNPRDKNYHFSQL